MLSGLVEVSFSWYQTLVWEYPASLPVLLLTTRCSSQWDIYLVYSLLEPETRDSFMVGRLLLSSSVTMSKIMDPHSLLYMYIVIVSTTNTIPCSLTAIRQYMYMYQFDDGTACYTEGILSCIIILGWNACMFHSWLHDIFWLIGSHVDHLVTKHQLFLAFMFFQPVK